MQKCVLGFGFTCVYLTSWCTLGQRNILARRWGNLHDRSSLAGRSTVETSIMAAVGFDVASGLLLPVISNVVLPPTKLEAPYCFQNHGWSISEEVSWFFNGTRKNEENINVHDRFDQDLDRIPIESAQKASITNKQDLVQQVEHSSDNRCVLWQTARVLVFE